MQLQRGGRKYRRRVAAEEREGSGSEEGSSEDDSDDMDAEISSSDLEDSEESEESDESAGSGTETPQRMLTMEGDVSEEEKEAGDHYPHSNSPAEDVLDEDEISPDLRKKRVPRLQLESSDSLPPPGESPSGSRDAVGVQIRAKIAENKQRKRRTEQAGEGS
jgi:hypothetical protein